MSVREDIIEKQIFKGTCNANKATVSVERFLRLVRLIKLNLSNTSEENGIITYQRRFNVLKTDGSLFDIKNIGTVEIKDGVCDFVINYYQLDRLDE
jgi:hypothetical protein